MDKKANRDKRMKNLTFKSKKGKDKEPERKTEKGNEQEKESTNLAENTLPNNWSRYEITDDDTEPGADFETLLQEPISNESHFKFKSEQNWDADIKSQLELNKYFTLDLKLLAEGISTIPFPTRHNFNTDLFTDVELDSIKRHSENNSQKYKKFLEKKFPAKNNNIIIKKNVDEKQNIKNETNEAKTKETKTKIETKEDKTKTNEIVELDKEINKEQKTNIVEIKETNIPEIKVEPKGQRVRLSKKQEDDVDELLNLKSPQKIEEPEIKDEDPLLQPTEIKKPPMPQQPSADLEQWLDDILDD